MSNSKNECHDVTGEIEHGANEHLFEMKPLNMNE
jgi:hypothetical protein